MSTILIKDANIVNENRVFQGDLLIKDGIIEKIGGSIDYAGNHTLIDASNKYVLPGAIDDQVHFREPGLTHKGEIYTEAKAAVAGGVTTFMEMPNTQPNTVTNELLEQKYAVAAQRSLANYSFYMGATNDNIDEVLRTDINNVCGVKIFMGSSTGNMLVDNSATLEHIFSQSPMLIATHCEDEETIRRNTEIFRSKYGDDIPIMYHPEIRSEEACYKSSSLAVELAKKHGTRLHILHISTAKELALFEAGPVENKKITAEACIHHLWFDKKDYSQKGALIKWNPAVKSPADKAAILEGVLNDVIDVIATDHAPHTLEEKQNPYLKAPSGGPLVQHSVVAMLELYHQKKISLEKIVEKMSHSPALLFQIDRRGFLREGYWADIAIADLDDPWVVKKENLLYKCGWSPFEDQLFHSKITHTLISGHLAYQNGQFDEKTKGKRLAFSRS